QRPSFVTARGIWRARRESNARPMASEAITLSPELRAREGKLYTARRGGLRPVSRMRPIVFDEAHGFLDRSGSVQPALHARPQHAPAAGPEAIPISPLPLPPYTRRSPRPAQAAPNSAAMERAAAGRSSSAEQNRHTERLAMSDPDD